MSNSLPDPRQAALDAITNLEEEKYRYLRELEESVVAIREYFKEAEEGDAEDNLVNAEDVLTNILNDFNAALLQYGRAVTCSMCNRVICAETAHLHAGDWVGDECCWDERLKMTE